MMPSKEVFAESTFLCCTIASAGVIIAILGFLLVLGLPLFRENTLFAIWTGPWAPQQGAFGVWAMITGTFWIAFSAAIICLPLSLGMSFVIASLGGKRIRALFLALVRFMTGIPTVIYGFVGIFLLVPLIRQGIGGPGMCVLSASIMLAILISPTMILFFTNSLLAVNTIYIQAAKVLGANRVQRLLYVMVPRALGGMVSGFILALGRAMGDTLIALMLAGNAIRPPQGFLEPARTLTAHIALVKAADFDSMAFRSIFACGITLYLFTILATIAVRMVARERVAVS